MSLIDNDDAPQRLDGRAAGLYVRYYPELRGRFRVVDGELGGDCEGRDCLLVETTTDYPPTEPGFRDGAR